MISTRTHEIQCKIYRYFYDCNDWIAHWSNSDWHHWKYYDSFDNATDALRDIRNNYNARKFEEYKLIRRFRIVKIN